MNVVQESWVLFTLERSKGAFSFFGSNLECMFPERPEFGIEKLGGA